MPGTSEHHVSISPSRVFLLLLLLLDTVMDPDPATAKFAQALPFVLLPVSPKLAALHSARTRANAPAACSRCGADATFQRTRVVRSKQPRSPQPTRIVLTTCTACDGTSIAPFQPGNVPSFSARKRKSIALAVPSAQVVVPASASQVKTAPLPVLDQPTLKTAAKPQANVRENRAPAAHPSSSKNKKKSSLQQMLERNREKEKQKTKAGDPKQPAGLSAFLSTL